METTKVIAWVDIQAPIKEVYEAVLDIEKRMQLSPLWGTTTLEFIDPDYPEVGSTISHKLVSSPHTAYRAIITALVPLKQLAYKLTVDRKTTVTWRFKDLREGTRITYEEKFEVQPGENESFSNSVHNVIQEWLQNIKRYVELREGHGQRLIKWFLDRFYLRLRPDQRKTIQLIFFMHGVGIIASIIAIIAWGIAFALK